MYCICVCLCLTVSLPPISKSLHIAHDPHHPLQPYFTLLPSGRRFRQLSCRTTRFCKSFIPSAITALNSRWFVVVFCLSVYVCMYFFWCYTCFVWNITVKMNFPSGTINHESKSCFNHQMLKMSKK